MNKFFKFLGDALFPENFTCDICGTETFGNNICPKCFKTLTFNNGAVCQVCGRKTAINGVCLECKAKAPLFRKAVSPLVYDGGAKILIARFKNGNAYLGNYLGKLIYEKLNELPATDCIVYVPMTEKAEYKRGYNQALLIAEKVSALSGIPLINGCIVKTKDTAEQKTLSAAERVENLRTCFKVVKRDEIKNKNVLLIDDVLTTGATSECVTRKLLKAGAAHVYFATAASVEYKPKKNG